VSVSTRGSVDDVCGAGAAWKNVFVGEAGRVDDQVLPPSAPRAPIHFLGSPDRRARLSIGMIRASNHPGKITT
jgi:hypothetical protein